MKVMDIIIMEVVEGDIIMVVVVVNMDHQVVSEANLEVINMVQQVVPMVQDNNLNANNSR